MKATLTSRRDERDFTPALPQLWAYDGIVAGFTRQTAWRGDLLRQLDPRPGDVIADLGCGAGSLLTLVGATGAEAELIGVDPDERILSRARHKLAAAGLAARLTGGYPRDARSRGGAGEQNHA